MAESNAALKEVGKMAGGKALTSVGTLPVGLVVLFIAFLVFIVLFVMSIFQDDEIVNTPQYNVKGISAQVMQFKSAIETELVNQGLDTSMANVLLAILQQESGGNIARTNGDIFQSSESMSGGKMGVITDPNVSIKYGVKHFKNVLTTSNNNLDVAIQSYNYGIGFATWIQGKEPTLEKRFEFSAEMKQKPQYASSVYTGVCRYDAEAQAWNACYGDPYYLDKVKNYLVILESDGDFMGFAGDGNFAMPIAGTMTMTSDYGLRIDPITGEGSMHKGIDFGCVNYVTAIRSIAAGRIVFSGVQNGYGNIVIVQHEQSLFSAYAHLSSLSVNVGDSVTLGQQIGVCGSTGRSTGPHLHLEVRREKFGGFQDPKSILGL
ncbi:lysozyme family protein [Bacillus taeanensis]|uniref:Peptidase M23 n=1 Tax=Bacillus taeanensis TaxID=273032 RepID=A0A366XU10_9BACI|nr:lysozyme family protein [Bacillus taeanensis]RBW68249.1 peptidase M23 [Bacillus taeanensis]